MTKKQTLEDAKAIMDHVAIRGACKVALFSYPHLKVFIKSLNEQTPPFAELAWGLSNFVTPEEEYIGSAYRTMKKGAVAYLYVALVMKNFYHSADGYIYYKYYTKWWRVATPTESTVMWSLPPQPIKPVLFSDFVKCLPHLHANIRRMTYMDSKASLAFFKRRSST
ncbi:MAG: hypothetical protein AAFP77_19735 [Bacteroidota bacterium]